MSANLKLGQTAPFRFCLAAPFRFGLSALCGAAITFLLLTVMYGLIASGDISSEQQALKKIADIWQTDRSITDQVKQLLPEKPDKPLEPPPEMPDIEMELDAPWRCLILMV